MQAKFVSNRILGTRDVDTPEVKDQIKQKIKAASAGVLPYSIRELMKQSGHRILYSGASDQEKEDAKLMICYSWWARALEGGIPKKHFEEFMLDHLAYLDDKPKGAPGIKKWEKYGG